MRCSGDMFIGLSNAILKGMFLFMAAAGVVRRKTAGSDAFHCYMFWQFANSLFDNVSYSVNMYFPFQEAVGRYRELELFLTFPHVETNEGEAAAPGWPSKGRLSFRSVTFHYAPGLP